MTISESSYYYAKQLRDYNLQFMAIFEGLQVAVGASDTAESRLISVPVHYAYPDRVVASILAENTQNKPIRLPCMSAMMTNMSLDEAAMHGTAFERRISYVPVGGVVPDDISVIHQRMPVPYKLEFELNMFASNMDQMFQMMEQILMIFCPSIDIERSDAIFDWCRLSKVTLTNVRMENNYPSGTDRRVIQTMLVFEMTSWLSAPGDVRKDFVEKIYMRVGAVTGDLDNVDIINELDAQGAEYEVVTSDQGINI